MLDTVEEPVRAEVYKLLNVLKTMRVAPSEDAFLKQIDTDICELLTQMKQKDSSYIFRSIAILSETEQEGLKGSNLMMPNALNKLARDVVETVVHSKLVYDKNSPDRIEVVLALSRLAKHDAFVTCMKSAISGLTEAVSSNDRNVRIAAVEAISGLARRDEFRPDLVPAVQKLTQQISGWDEDAPEEYPLNLIEMMISLVEYKEFRTKLKYIVPILMKQLPNSPKGFHSGSDKVCSYLMLLLRCPQRYSSG
ncbi:hypothetical protein BJ912DRAFT_162643 [Pholiota molesta]|nr:hypothetical protein BJ912DRAFT_162643 [Pholiota molesta]